ncbi:MAG: hypothetical protein HQL95_10150 [Magnetococcales bacterium]|nr:hypothetical protein [Magnetococcales bacterium]
MWNLIQAWYRDLPEKYKIIAFFVVLIASVYLLMSPTFINGRMVIRSVSGGEIPYAGGTLQMRSEGRVLKFTVSDDGDWSIPLISRIPSDIELQVYHVDDKEWHNVPLSVSDVYFSKKIFKIVVQKTLPKFVLSQDKSLDSEMSFIVQAFAEPPFGTPRVLSKKEFEEIITKTLSLDPIQAGNLANRKLTHVEKLEIIQGVKKHTRASSPIPQERWIGAQNAQALLESVQ